MFRIGIKKILSLGLEEEPKIKETLREIFQEELKKLEFETSPSDINILKFGRTITSTVTPTDKIGILRRVQFSGVLLLTKSESGLVADFRLNYLRQFLLSFLSLGVPIFFLFLVYPMSLTAALLIWLVPSLTWYISCVYIGRSLILDVIRKSTNKIL